jgi:alpha-galactosidase
VHLKRELLKEHHDRVIRRSKRKLKWQRNQYVLDLTQPEVRKSGNNPAQTGTIGRLLAV